MIHLDACLAEADAQGDLLAQKDVGIVGLLEEGLQLLQLLRRECGAIASLSPSTEHVLSEKIARQRRYKRSGHQFEINAIIIIILIVSQLVRFHTHTLTHTCTMTKNGICLKKKIGTRD